jgi:uncharacterized membrane protein YgcG
MEQKMTALELFLCACVIVMIALAAYFFLQTRKAIAERERSHNEFMERKRAFERNMADFESKPRRDNRGTSVDLSQPLTTILYDVSPSYGAPEHCDSSSFSDSSYSCDSGSSSSDSGSSGGGE